MHSSPFRNRRFPRSGRSTAATVVLSTLLVLGGCSSQAPADEADAAEAGASTRSNIAVPSSQLAAVEWPTLGKYGCAESIPRLVGGSYEYSSEGRGFLTVDGRGGYVDPFGVQGSYRYDAAANESHFSGGALDNAVVTPLDGEGPRLWIVIPTASGERRWSCSLTEEA